MPDLIRRDGAGYFTMIAFSRRWIRRTVDYVVLPLALGFVALVLALRLWILPDIDRWRDDIAASISAVAGQKVTLGQLTADWQGLRPRLQIRDIRVFGRDNRPVLFLADVRAALSWTTLLHGELRLASLAVDDVVLTVRRDKEGVIHVAGIPLNQPGAKTHFGDWLLAQSNILVSHATLAWQDEQRDAPLLVVRDVNLTMQNRRHRHAFQITATPPAQLAQPLDLRGEFEGRSLNDFSDWRGKLYARVDRTDLGEWRQWLDLPYAISQGYGGLRVWLEVARQQVIAVTADVALRGLAAQFSPELPTLRLADLSGRVAWKRLGLAQSVEVKKFTLRTRDFLYVPPFDLRLRFAPASTGKPAEGLIETHGAQLDRLTTLTAWLPLDAAWRQRLDELAPRGRLENFALTWRGDAGQLADYSVKGRFVGLGLRAVASLPGVTGLTGNIDASRKGGTLAINSATTTLSLPHVLFEPDVFLDTLTAQINWREQGAGYAFRLTEASFANADLAGSAFGDYRWQPGRQGEIDLTGRLTRAQLGQAYRYLPLVVKEHTYQWVRAALQGGQAREASFRVRGDLARFPFRGGKAGLFEAAARIDNGVLQYATGWPRIENIRADLHFAGERMEIRSDSANIYGARLRRVSAVIPDLESPDEVLEVKGEAAGPLAEFVRFANTSPIAQMLDGVTENLRASGDSQLRLDMKIPLRRGHHTAIAGDITFNGNTLTPARDIPVLEDVRGRLVFTESGLSAQNIRVRLLGGPATIAAVTQADGVTRLTVQGRMSAPALRPHIGAALAGRLRGAAEWRASISLRRLQAEVDFETDLVGMASDLPPPFAKAASDSQPLRVEKRLRPGGEATLAIRYGRVATAIFLQKEKAGESVVERGTIRFGGEAELPEEAGLWIAGSLRLSDLDRWRNELAAAEAAPSGLPSVAGVNLSFNALDMFGRRFQDINISARHRGGVWRAAVAGRGVAGEISWRPASGRPGETQDKLSAAFKTLVIPPPSANGAAQTAQAGGGTLPALDLTVENLQMGSRRLGRLNVDAVPEEGGLRFDSIRLVHPDSTLAMEGNWRPDRIPQTQARIRLEVNDIGKFLARFDHADLVRRGQAVVDGQAEWNGTPVDIAIPSLAGTFSIKASNGQFLKADPGIGKLLGVISLQALPRRISLDFRDVFSDGFAFDEISGTMRLSRGVVYSNDFRMQGPAAKVSMSGVVDINAETQQLRVTVAPKLSESVALAGTLIGGPVVGLGALAVSKLLRDPFGQAATFEYMVTGSWTEPVVTKVASKPEESEQQP